MKRARERPFRPSARPFVRQGERLHNRIPINQQQEGRKEGWEARKALKGAERETNGHGRGTHTQEGEGGYLSKISQRLTASSVLSLAAISDGSNRSGSKIGGGIGFKDSFAYFVQKGRGKKLGIL